MKRNAPNCSGVGERARALDSGHRAGVAVPAAAPRAAAGMRGHDSHEYAQQHGGHQVGLAQQADASEDPG